MFACLFILFKEVFQKKLSSPQKFFYHSHRHSHSHRQVIVIVIVIVIAL